MKKTVYLCGAIMGRTDEECVDWRERVKQTLSCPIIDPMARDFRGQEREELLIIVETDKAEIDTCDILLVNYCEPTVGTSMEILYAWERGKTVVIVAEESEKLSPWLLYHQHKRFFTLDDAVTYINKGCVEDEKLRITVPGQGAW